MNDASGALQQKPDCNWNTIWMRWSKKPGALAGSMPLEQCRAQGRWPESFDSFWGKLEHRHGEQDGTRAMVDVLLLGSREHGFERLRATR